MGRRKEKKSKRARDGGAFSDQKKAALLRDLGRSPDEHPVFSLPSPLLPWGGVFLFALLTLVARPLVRDGRLGILFGVAIVLAAHCTGDRTVKLE